MANRLKMAIVQTIQRLHASGWSQRRIARELAIDRETVRRYVACGETAAKPAISPAGSLGSKPATFSPLPGAAGDGCDGTDDTGGERDSKPAISPAGSVDEADTFPSASLSLSGLAAEATGDDIGPEAARGALASQRGRPSHCKPYRAIILQKLEQQLSAQRIYQDLVSEHGFTGAYDCVKRFVRRLGVVVALPVRRLECAVGEEAQVDFGSGAWIETPDGTRRKSHVFRIVLSHSRKGYSEATSRQTTEDFIRALENAFVHFGGVPRTLVIDNLRAAVSHPDWFDPELVPKIQSFCEHYGTVILPTKSYTPRHKGKVEAAIKYVKNNGLKGRRFRSLEEANRHLANWEATVADTRIHGTTRRQVGKVFAEVERAALLPLPLERFALFHEAQRKVNRDGHVEVAKAYYSVPPEYLGRTVWARWDARLVRVFNQRFESIAVHVRHEPGRYSTHAGHIAREKISGLERGVEYLLGKLSPMGPHTQQWAEAMLVARGIQGTRVLLGLVSLTKHHTTFALEKACEIALSHGAFRLRTLRQLIARHATAEQLPLEFLDEHPIIRPLDDYAAVVAAALERTAQRQRRDGNKEEEEEDRVFSGMTEHKHVAVSLRMNGSASPQNKTAPMVATIEAPADLLPPRSGYPSSGCSPAEPDSVSPDASSVTFDRPVHQFHPEENTP
jgi:transposase